VSVIARTCAVAVRPAADNLLEAFPVTRDLLRVKEPTGKFSTARRTGGLDLTRRIGGIHQHVTELTETHPHK
jgi:hypothetical protein